MNRLAYNLYEVGITDGGTKRKAEADCRGTDSGYGREKYII
ncbi:hypothetical protein BRYFOR_08967 [Marvinbryantia formatexigens DSM 14469]|uniref:Uncharacterized protein n=1 Tax=Marvinbryantia formatexigens DSM 14469 TaxID=478749 RepID=C6LJY0_9FIRM|nr:hypothetical protein BRYFOR_08967 [Marvinbryantia formatexigens DSM 14469]